MPEAMRFSSLVNRRRKPGMMAMLTAVMSTPCTRLSTMPWVAAVSAFLRSPAPRYSAIMALMPTPKPMAMAFAKFWMGYTSDRAVTASSLMRATNRLSTMLYRLFTSMEMTFGSAIEISSGSTGFSFIKVSFMIFGSLLQTKNCAQKSHTMAFLKSLCGEK